MSGWEGSCLRFEIGDWGRCGLKSALRLDCDALPGWGRYRLPTTPRLRRPRKPAVWLGWPWVMSERDAADTDCGGPLPTREATAGRLPQPRRDGVARVGTLGGLVRLRRTQRTVRRSMARCRPWLAARTVGKRFTVGFQEWVSHRRMRPVDWEDSGPWGSLFKKK